MKKIPMTGAAGGVGAFLRSELSGRYELLLSDLRDMPDLDANERFMAADLSDPDAVLRVTEGMDGIIHPGGYAVEGPWPVMRNATRLGYRPMDNSGPYARDVLAHAPPEDPDSIATRCQGGNFATSESGGDPPKPDQTL